MKNPFVLLPWLRVRTKARKARPAPGLNGLLVLGPMVTILGCNQAPGAGFTSLSPTAMTYKAAGLVRAESVDVSFVPDARLSINAVNSSLNVVALQPDGRILIGGSFFYELDSKHQICDLARLNSDGSLDTSFIAGGGIAEPGYFSIDTEGIDAIKVLRDGRIMIGGDLHSIGGSPATGLALLNADGGRDYTFNPAFIASQGHAEVHTVAFQANGQMLIGGYFASVNGISRNGIARLNPDGTVDLTFNPGTGISAKGSDPMIYAITLQADGRVLIGGTFDSYNGQARNAMTRLNSDGSLDPSFDQNLKFIGVLPTVMAIVIQPDGKLLVGGWYQAINGFLYPRGGIARLNANGTLDETFDGKSVLEKAYLPGLSRVFAVQLQRDGKVLIGGYFGGLQDFARMGAFWTRHGIARLYANGGFDDSFDPGSGTGGAPIGADQDVYITSMTVQPDGKVLVGGHFYDFNGLPRESLARLNAEYVPPAPPQITRQPQSQTTPLGGVATFEVTATPEGYVNYQWQKNGTNLYRQNNPALRLANVQLSDAGSYSIVVSNAIGSITSTAAILTVSMPPRVTLLLNILPAGGGTISASPQPETDGKYLKGTMVSLTANSSPGYVFDSWTGDALGTGNPTTISMNDNKSVTASFKVHISAPGKPVVSDLIATSAKVSWPAASDSLGHPLRYEVQYWDMADVTQHWVIPDITNTWVTIGGLYPDSQYGLFSKAVDSTGAWSSWSATTDFKTPVAKP